jgi:hypothetical protein
MDLQRVLELAGTYVGADPVVVFLLVAVAAALVRTLFLSRRISLLTRGATGASLESTIRTLESRVTKLEAHATQSERALNNLDARVQSAVRAVSVRRFDPFQNAGGQQSFASALLDEHGDGVVLSGIHSRDTVRVYAKEVRAFTSTHELSEDERTSIADAKKKLA